MKKIIYAATFLSLLSCSTQELKTVEETVKMKAFGPEKVDESKAVSTADMLAQFDSSKGEQTFTFEGKIVEVCSKAGCWVNIDKGHGETFMVRFKDHFTIPTNTPSGTRAFLHGTAVMDTTSVADLQHFAEDAGKSKEEIAKITEPEFNLNFTADGILFKEVSKTEKTK